MSFFSDFSFFFILALLMMGAAYLGLHERSMRRYGLYASIFMLFALFVKTPLEGLFCCIFLADSLLCANFLWGDPKSARRFHIALALTLVPLVACKVSGAFSANILGFTGISYVTFRSVQVLVETHDGLIERMKMSDYLYFLIFFPTFTSGPIDRSRRFEEDLDNVPSKDEYSGMLANAILLIMLGMVYKIVLATIFEKYWVPEYFNQYNEGTAVAIWRQFRNCIAYGLYLFFDFAGYSWMAEGAGLAFGIHVPRNFRAPFLSTSITDFWNRWHITLSTWLRDFCFMRIARSLMRRKAFKGKSARLRTAQTAMIANMLIMGFWHGLSIDYILYGLYHGVLLALEQSWERTKFYKTHRHKTWYRICSWAVTMALVFFGFALFCGQITLLVKGA